MSTYALSPIAAALGHSVISTTNTAATWPWLVKSPCYFLGDDLPDPSKRRPRDYTHPYYWAPFILVGAPALKWGA